MLMSLLRKTPIVCEGSYLNYRVREHKIDANNVAFA